MTKEKMVPLLAILVIAGAVAWIYRSRSGSQKFDLSPYHALGAGTAEETAKLLGNKGSVLVISEDTSESKNPAVDGQLQSFQATLQQNRTLSLVAVEKFKLSPMERMATGGAITRENFLKALQGHPNIGAVVLFCAFPPLDPPDYAALKQSGVKVITASACVPGYRKLVESQVIHLAIVPRFERPAPTGNSPKSLREWFEQEFLVVSATNATALPY